MTVGEICNRTVVFCRRQESVLEVARRMRTFHVGDLVVVEDREDGTQRVPIGIVTDRDLVVRALAEHPDRLDSLTVDDVFTSHLVTAHDAESLLDALKRMRSHGVRRLPVVSADGALQGILTFDDLIECLSEEMSDLTELIVNEQKRERHLR